MEDFPEPEEALTGAGAGAGAGAGDGTGGVQVGTGAGTGGAGPQAGAGGGAVNEVQAAGAQLPAGAGPQYCSCRKASLAWFPSSLRIPLSSAFADEAERARKATRAVRRIMV